MFTTPLIAIPLYINLIQLSNTLVIHPNALLYVPHVCVHMREAGVVMWFNNYVCVCVRMDTKMSCLSELDTFMDCFMRQSLRLLIV